MAAKRLRPMHPGDILTRDFMEPLGLSSRKLARMLRVSLPTVVALAESRGISEAALALLAIRALLESNGLAVSRNAVADRDVPASDRITVRLRPGDRRAIAERARRRWMRDATHIAALVRSHVATNPPLPANELAAFKQAVSILVAVGRAEQNHGDAAPVEACTRRLASQEPRRT